MKSLISIVVPVYNVERYLRKCVDSLVNQSYLEIEILLIDDGSTDMSGEICDQLESIDSRIKVFHKENGGLMSAWKYGVLRATGDYVGFVDSDDWIDSDMYERLLKCIRNTKADVAICGLVKEFEDGSPTENERILLNKECYTESDVANEILPILICSGTYPTRGVSPNRVTKLYSKSLILSVLNYCPDNVSIGEDLVSTFAVMSKKPRVGVVYNYFPYHYRINNASMIASFSKIKYEKIRELNKALCAINEENEGYFEQQIANDYVDLILQTIEQEVLLSNDCISRIIGDIKEEINNSIFIISLGKADKQKLRRKYQFYLIMFKLHLFKSFVFLRRHLNK